MTKIFFSTVTHIIFFAEKKSKKLCSAKASNIFFGKKMVLVTNNSFEQTEPYA